MACKNLNMKKIVLLFVLTLVGCAQKNNFRTFQFTYAVKIESTDGKKREMWLPIPQSNEVQTISDLIIKTNGLEHSIEDEKVHGNKYLYINHKSGTTKSTTVVLIFNVLRKEHQNVNYKNVNPQKYLGEYTTVPTGGIFKKIISYNNLSRYDVRGIYDYVLVGMHYGKPKSIDDRYYNDPWLSEHTKYGIKQVGRDNVVTLYKKSKKEGGNYTFGNGNAIYACDIGVGNCTDYHSYFMSLDRTMGIPTRFHMGFPIPSNESGKVDGYHCWADYYIHGKGWYPVDISMADIMPKKKDYFFGSLDQNRVEMMVGRDFILKGYETELTNFFIYPTVEVDDKESSAFSKSFSYKNL